MSESNDNFLMKETATLLAKLEKDIIETETGMDSTYNFEPLCWLQSSFTNFAADIGCFTILGPNIPYAAMLFMLRDKINLFTKQEGPTSADVKFILILCELILLCPVHKTSPNINIALTDLLQARFSTKIILKDFQGLVYEAIDKVIILSVVAGSNPIPGLFYGDDKPDIIGLLRSVKVGTHNVSAFRCVLGLITTTVANLAESTRHQFCIEFYSLLGSFNVEHPSMHHEMLSLTVNQAQMVIDAILSWHNAPDVDELPVLCALLPLCKTCLMDMMQNKKSKYHSILKALGDVKFKKNQNFIGACFAYLELYAALVHLENIKADYITNIKDFMHKHQEKFEKSIFNSKDKIITSDSRLLNEFVPRYAAVDFANKVEGQAMKYLQEVTSTIDGWGAMATFFYIATDGYPLTKENLKFDNSKYQAMAERLVEALGNICNTNCNKELLESSSSAAINIAKHLTQGLHGDPLVSALTIARGDPATEWSPTPALTAFLTAIQQSNTTSKVLCALFKAIASASHNIVTNLIPLLLIIWAHTPYWTQNINIQVSSKIIQDLTLEIRSSVTDAVNNNAQSLEILPGIFLSFLRWAETVLIKRSRAHGDKKNEGASFTQDMSENMTITIALLRGTCGKSRAYDISEDTIDRIFRAFGMAPINRYPYSGANGGEIPQMPAIKIVLRAWFGYIASFTRGIIKGAEKNPKFVPSQERIAVMTEFIARYVDTTNLTLSDGKVCGPTAECFFDAAFQFMSRAKVLDKRFGQAFSHLHPSVDEQFNESVRNHGFNAYINSRFASAAYWINFITMCTGRASDPNLTASSYEFLQKAIVQFISIYSLDLFIKSKHQMTPSIIRFIKAIYLGKHQPDQLRWYLTVTSLADVLIKFSDRASANFSESKLESLIEIFPIILHGFKVDGTQAVAKLPDHELQINGTNNMFYLITAFDKCLQSCLTPKLVNKVYDSVLEILAANPGLGWRMLVTVAHSVGQVMSVVLVEAFTEYLGMRFYVVNRMHRDAIKSIQCLDPTDLLKNVKGRDRFSKEEADQYEKLIIQNLIYYSRSIRKPSKLDFSAPEPKLLTDVLVDNNFDFFLNPPTDKPKVLASAIRCLATSSHIHELFDYVAHQCKGLNGKLPENLRFFFQAFLLSLVFDTDLATPLHHAINQNPEKFIEAINPNYYWAYYFVKLYQITNSIDLCKEVYVESFIRPYLISPMDYNVEVPYVTGDLKLFIDRIKASDALTSCIIGILKMEPIIAHVDIPTFDYDREVVLSVLGRAKSTIHIPQTLQTAENISAHDLLNLQKHRWIEFAGYTNENTPVFLLRLSKIHRCAAATVAEHLIICTRAFEKIELVVYADRIPEYIQSIFKDFLAKLPPNFVDKITYVHLARVSTLYYNVISKIEFTKLGDKFKLCEDVSELYKDHPHITLPVWALAPEETARAYGIVTLPSGNFAKLIITDSELIIKSQKSPTSPKLLNENISTYHEIYISEITDIIQEEGGITIQYKAEEKFNILRLKTISPDLYINAFKSIKSWKNFKPPVTLTEIELNCSKSLRGECAALGLHLISLKNNAMVTSAIHLFETAIKNTKFSPDAYFPIGPVATYQAFFHELINSNLLEDVVPRLSDYMVENPESCVPLLELLVIFLNREKNQVILSRVIINVIKCMRNYTIKDTDESSVSRSKGKRGSVSGAEKEMETDSNVQNLRYMINRFLWSKITAREAIEIAVAELLRNKVPKIVVGYVFKQFVDRDPEYMGHLLIEKILDGTVRRNPYGNPIKHSRIFGALKHLPFSCPKFVEGHIAALVFSSVFGSVHVEKDTSDIITFLRSTVMVIEKEYPEKNGSIITRFQVMEKLLERHREMIVSQLISAGSDLCNAFSPHEKARYEAFINSQEPGENPNMWYIKAAAMVQNGNRDTHFVNKFVDLLPSLFQLKPGHLRLELCFDTLSSIIPDMEPSSLVPLILVWPALYSTCVLNIQLRNSALKLLNVCIQFAYDHGDFKNIGGIETTTYISTQLTKTLDEFRASFGSDPENPFIYVLSQALSRGFESQETQEAAIAIAKTCINALKDRPFLATHFVMPLIAYTDLDILPICSCFTEQKTPAEIIFENFEQRRELDQVYIAAYMSNCITDGACKNYTHRIAEILTYGAQKFPPFFKPFKTNVVSRCWKMIDSNVILIEELDLFATISAMFMSIPDSGVDYTETAKKFKFEKIGDQRLSKIISRSLNGIIKAIKLVG